MKPGMPQSLLDALDSFARATGRLRPASEILADKRGEPAPEYRPWWTR